MTIQPAEGVYGNGAGVTTPIAHRLAQAGGITKTSGIAIRPGLFWGGSATIVTGTANMSYNVAAFTAAATRGGTGGAYTFANDGTVNVATTAAPGSNSRYDVVYAWQRDYAIDGSNSTPVIGVVQGTAASSPSVPSLSSFPGAIELARILVPSGVTATNSGTTITQTAPFTASAGGVVPVRNLTERDAGTWLESQVVWDISTDIEWTHDGSTWNAPYGSYLGRAVRASNTPTVANASFTDLSTTANWSTTSTAGMVKNFASYSNGWTIPASGVYEVSYSIASSAGVGLLVGITVNDSSVVVGDLKFSSVASVVQSVASTTVTGQSYFAANDVIRLYALAASGTPALNASQGHFSVTWVRAA